MCVSLRFGLIQACRLRLPHRPMVIYEQHFVGDGCSVISRIKEECDIVLRLGFVVRCVSMKTVCCFFFTAGSVGRAPV